LLTAIRRTISLPGAFKIQIRRRPLNTIATTFPAPHAPPMSSSLQRVLFALFVLAAGASSATVGAETEVDRVWNEVQGFEQPLNAFFLQYCSDCHSEGAEEGGFEIEALSGDLRDPAAFARWEQIFDRVVDGEMPPEDSLQPSDGQRQAFGNSLGNALNRVHGAEKSTVLRRLNRREYENTINDTFGTNLDLRRMLPEGARSHEFDNIGASLGLSMVHMRRYMDAAERILDSAISDSVEPPKAETITAWYRDSREAERFVGDKWKLLDDGAVVQFNSGGYPSGMLRGSNVNRPGRYRVRLVAYAHQTAQPMTFFVGGTSFKRGSDQPIYGFFEALPDEPKTFEFETWIDSRYMLQIEPYGISDIGRDKNEPIENYEGPGLAVGKVTLEGPLVDEFPSKGHRLMFEGLRRQEIPPRNPRDRERRNYQARFGIESDDPAADVRPVLTRVASKLFRRPVEGGEVAPYVELFEQQLEQGDSFEASLRTAVTAILCSPQFLFFQENAGTLNDHALASRLSYFLTRTSPDHGLLQAAAVGRLTESTELIAQAERLIKHRHFERFVVDFVDSWLDLREIDFTAPDQKLYPEFDSFLRHSMPRETYSFVRELIASNLPIRNLVDSDFAMLNSRLAAHYGLPPVKGTAIRKVSLPADSIRGGLLSQASILKVTANGTNTSPVTRGAWVMERIQGVVPPPPPPGIPGVEPDIRGATTLRELLDKHRDSINCQACHRKIDPPGFALECFNPIGGYRDRYRSLGDGERVDERIRGRKVRYKLGPDVDASGTLVDGASFEDFRQFRELLAENEAMLARTFVTKLLTFATGREMGFSDRAEIDEIIADASDSQYAAGELLKAVVASKIFRSK
jgi:hypothetical protein